MGGGRGGGEDGGGGVNADDEAAPWPTLFTVTRCGHVLCRLCVAASSNHTCCPVCGVNTLCAPLMNNQGNIPPEFDMYFAQPAAILEQGLQTYRFQAANMTRLVRFLKNKVTRQKHVMEKVKAELINVKALKEHIHRLERENQELRQTPRPKTALLNPTRTGNSSSTVTLSTLSPTYTPTKQTNPSPARTTAHELRPLNVIQSPHRIQRADQRSISLRTGSMGPDRATTAQGNRFVPSTNNVTSTSIPRLSLPPSPVPNHSTRSSTLNRNNYTANNAPYPTPQQTSTSYIPPSAQHRQNWQQRQAMILQNTAPVRESRTSQGSGGPHRTRSMHATANYTPKLRLNTSSGTRPDTALSTASFSGYRDPLTSREGTVERPGTSLTNVTSTRNNQYRRFV